MPDHRVLDALAERMGTTLRVRTLAQVHAEIDQLGAWDGARLPAPEVATVGPPAVGPGQAVLATWHLLLDAGRCQDGERFLAGTAQRGVARLSAAMAEGLRVTPGDPVTVRTSSGEITLPLEVTPMPDGVVWLPLHSRGSMVRSALRADAGDVVEVSAAEVSAAALPATPAPEGEGL